MATPQRYLEPSMSRIIHLLAVLVLPLGSLSAAEKLDSKGEWAQFHGPARNNVSPDTGLLTKWPEGGPPLVWQTKGAGRGYASLAISGGRIYTLGDGLSTAEDKDEYASCFDLASGKQLWISKLGPAWKSGQPDWQSSRSTPTVDNDRVYVLAASGKLACLETMSGREIWTKNVKEDFGGKRGDGWGYSESVLIDGENLVCTPGGVKTTMVALKKKTGELVWSTAWGEDRGAGHASIAISEIGGVKIYVQTTAGGALGVRAKDGKVLWTYPIERTTAVAPSPIVRGDLVFFSAGYGRGGALLKQVRASDDEVNVEEVYPLNKDLANKHGGVVLVGDYLYGDLDDKGMPFCAEFLTGNVQWQKKRGAGSRSIAMAAADSHLYLRYASGHMVLAKASPEAYEEVSSFKIPGSGERPSWSHPVILGGKLYLREQDAILCYDLRAK